MLNASVFPMVVIARKRRLKTMWFSGHSSTALVKPTLLQKKDSKKRFTFLVPIDKCKCRHFSLANCKGMKTEINFSSLGKKHWSCTNRFDGSAWKAAHFFSIKSG